MTDKEPKPLKAKTMTLHQLQMETLSLIRKVRFQLNRQPWQGGMSSGSVLATWSSTSRELDAKATA